MNGRVRPVDGLLGAAATAAVAIPLVTLFSPPTWFRPALVVLAAVCVSGALLRWLTGRAWLVVLGQVVVGTMSVVLLHVPHAHLFYLLPTPRAVRDLARLFSQAAHDVMAFSAPVPTRPGITLALGMLLGLTGLAVDALGVTLRRPALAGLPLLAAFLAIASNSGPGLDWWFFCVPAVVWLALIGRQGVASVRSWGTAVSRSVDGTVARDPGDGFAGMARMLALGALALAIALPAMIPHLPTTFVAGGLSRAPAGGGDRGAVRLTSTVDVAANLNDRSNRVVLRYTSSSRTPPPLRVDVLSRFDGGQWRNAPESDGIPEERIPAPDYAPAVNRGEVELAVETNGLAPPQLAVPAHLTALNLPAGTWRATPDGVLSTSRVASSYRVRFADLQPRRSDFGSGRGTPQPQHTFPDDTEAKLEQTLREIVPEDATALETAQAIQAYLRGPGFTYATVLETPKEGPADPMGAFLTTKRGYCVQFSSAMIALAQRRGIPGRMGIGFLPGTFRNGVWEVQASDAHAWPELYFPSVGWLRFEPTPGVRSGVAPDYSVPTSSSASPSATSSPGSTASRSPSRPRGLDQGQARRTTQPAAPSLLDRVREHGVSLLAGLVLILALGALPLGAWVRRSRARREARTDAERVEVEWRTLVSRLADIGMVAPDGATPRQAGGALAERAYLQDEPRDALGRVVATLERARYAPPDGTPLEMRTDADAVWRAAARGRRWRERLRAGLLPGDGVAQWRDSARAVGDLPRAALRRLRNR